MKCSWLILFYILLNNFLYSCNSNSEESSKEIISNFNSNEKEAPEVAVFHASHESKKQDAPLSDVVQAGNTFYLSGQIGMDHSIREVVEGGITAETKQALENIRAVLAHHNLEMKDVVKATVILDDIDNFSAFNAIYAQYFPQKPARTTFAAEALARGAKIEIEVVAVASAQ